MAASIVTAFAAFALVIAVTGIYGVRRFSWPFPGAKSASGWRSARFIESQLFGIAPTDVSTYAAATAAVVATALAATWLPARQAARVDPAVTLRTG